MNQTIHNKKFASYAYSKSGKLRIDGLLTNRNKENEDYKKVDNYRGIFIVADGIGGNLGGRTASQHATMLTYRNMCDMYHMAKTEDVSDRIISEILAGHVEDTNICINAWSKLRYLWRCGTTIDAVFINDSKAYGAHVGDGIVYKIDTLDRTIHRLTSIDKDHDISDNLTPDLTPIEKEIVTFNRVSNYIGADKIAVQSYIAQIKPSDILIMATDGLTKKVHSEELLDSFTDNDFENGIRKLLAYNNNPVRMRRIIEGLRLKDYDISEDMLFNDDTTFIIIDGRDADADRN